MHNTLALTKRVATVALWRRTSVAVMAGLCGLLPARASSAQTTSPVVSSPAGILPTTQPSDLASRIDAKNASQSERDEAASRLAGLNTAEAKRALLAILQAGSHDAQLAVARSLTLVPHPDKAFIAPLGALLGGDRNLDEAASRALARLGSFPEARALLLNFARDTRQPAALRAVTIRAWPAIVDKNVADALVSLLSDENATLQNAASDALTELTGLSDIGRDPAAWKRWYDANKSKPDDAWKLAVYGQRDPRLYEIAQREPRILKTLGQVLTQEFQTAAPADRAAMVLRDMNSVDPEVRAIGAGLVSEAFLNGTRPTDEQQQRLTELVGDSDPHVRLEAARTLKALNFAGALDAMLAQLSVENDPDVKTALMAAVAQVGDVRAVPVLRRLLSDPSLTVQRAAVDALRSLGAAYYKADREGAHALALELWNLYEQRSKEPGTTDLQTACIEAIAPLHEEAKAVPLVRLLDAEQTDRMRSAALHALRDLGDPNTEDGIRNWLPQEPEASVRRDALDALNKTGSFGADAEVLYSFFKPGTGEQDASVREKAWDVFHLLLPTASKETLLSWAGTQLAKEPNHRLYVQLELDRQLAADKDLENLALQQQNTGATYLELNPPEYEQAAKYFQTALDYWLSQNQNNQVTELLVTQLMNALLKSHQYSQAARFAEKMISKNRSQQQTMGGAFVQEAESLQQDGTAASAANALKLISEAMRMKPALDGVYLDQLGAIQKQLQQKAPPQ